MPETKSESVGEEKEMSILIKGMGMPESCEDCSAQIIDPTGGASGCAVNHSIILRKRGERRPAECPLVEVPKHGRLIDADELTELCDAMADKCDGIGKSIWGQFRATVEWLPTIIEAEESDGCSD